jgi:hypothetical protein
MVEEEDIPWVLVRAIYSGRIDFRPGGHGTVP